MAGTSGNGVLGVPRGIPNLQSSLPLSKSCMSTCSVHRIGNREKFAGQEKKLSEFTIALLLPNPKLVYRRGTAPWSVVI